MSLQQTNSSAARSRSLRVPAKSALTAPQPVSATITSAQIPTTTSNTALFLTNLRLLDLDLEPDWPGINLATFSTKDAASGQKKRIQCVEWALYQLFALWDPNETQNKLRPFFPPLDQIQSTNLRAALLRGLEQAKKNGVLGRDAVLRKTMLDECKGERLEEVLAVFSSAVLKKLVAERALNSGPEYRPTVSENISLENWGYSGDRTELNTLLLAHKASLRSLLTRKDAAREKYRDFEKLLASKEQGLSQRKEQVKADTERSVAETSEKAKKEVYKIVKTNWTGNDQWIDSLLFNGTPSRKGGLLGSKFDDVWAGVREGRISDLEDQNSGLLEQLDNRVRLQKARLEKWDDFRKKMFGNMPPPPAEGSKDKGKSKSIDLGFTAHLGLSIDPAEIKDRVPLSAPPPQYASILSNMKTELDAIGKPKIPDFSNLLRGPRRSSVIDTNSDLAIPQSTTDPISDISEWEEEPEDIQPPEKIAKLPVGRRYRLNSTKPTVESKGQIPKISLSKASSYNEDAKDLCLSPEFDNPGFAIPQSFTSAKSLGKRQESAEPESTASFSTSYTEPSRDASPTELTQPSKTFDAIPPSPGPVSPTQAMADEILANMLNASPSPMKKHRHTLSLAERTRMSMTRTMSYERDEDLTQLSPIKPSHVQSSSDNTTSHPAERGEEYEDLVARTRRSMAGFEAAQQKARLERRRSERKSKILPKKDNYFPRLEEENMNDTSIAEELMEDDEVDYEAVFKSRPRVQTSPLPSPSKPWNGQ
ncbi:HAUS augmin-like complex subunit 6 N-terminus-domain-containing protein [Annulohypoxylon maeteangense]|uniref:HAUS augmin-like complex subunit 6 N-terminus-domain-containing protein n=1 Tax=Annulohypoxylon maeteangense TaxID=1927788 RepID=UPI002008E032|nr:HAUS augmin-like complex subunit 6 N-terminus-domain-containing protein [Annulohypoxylon maeteangense]KAI0888762.1 HAUS augmin-like complex subunit 6 N-terminus-domain-containing protein [Annulohypoxylon maeteangense]